MSDLIGLTLSTSMAKLPCFLRFVSPLFFSSSALNVRVLPNLCFWPLVVLPLHFSLVVYLQYETKLLEVIFPPRTSHSTHDCEMPGGSPQIHQKVLLTRKCHRDEMNVSLQWPYHHLTTDLVC